MFLAPGDSFVSVDEAAREQVFLGLKGGRGLRGVARTDGGERARGGGSGRRLGLAVHGDRRSFLPREVFFDAHGVGAGWKLNTS